MVKYFRYWNLVRRRQSISIKDSTDPRLLVALRLVHQLASRENKWTLESPNIQPHDTNIYIIVFPLTGCSWMKNTWYQCLIPVIIFWVGIKVCSELILITNGLFTDFLNSVMKLNEWRSSSATLAALSPSVFGAGLSNYLVLLQDQFCLFSLCVIST